MPRPIRIEYEHAYYHVMNRGRGRQTIFHDERYYTAFLETLEASHQRFDAVIHAYCLLGNHYHLLIETPGANLGRIMRHINGVYTQCYNRLKRRDGPLFRDRYKAILVDKDSYLLQLSCYIHRNPIEMKKPLVSDLASYSWSSYPAYIGKVNAPAWLYREQIYDMQGARQKYMTYHDYVEAGIDEDIERFYSKTNMAAILGGKAFRAMVEEEKKGIEVIREALRERPSAGEIVNAISKVLNLAAREIVRPASGRPKRNDARKLAMYCCQTYG